MKSFKEFIKNSKTKKKYPGPEKRVGPRRNTSSDNINWGGRRISDTFKESLILEENYDPDHPKNMRIVLNILHLNFDQLLEHYQTTC